MAPAASRTNKPVFVIADPLEEVDWEEAEPEEVEL